MLNGLLTLETTSKGKMFDSGFCFQIDPKDTLRWDCYKNTFLVDQDEDRCLTKDGYKERGIDSTFVPDSDSITRNDSRKNWQARYPDGSD